MYSPTTPRIIVTTRKRRKPPPTPIPWTPRFIPEEWVYKDDSGIEGHPCLGAAVVHIPTHTTIYINAKGCEETRTIMWAELVAIHTALSRFEEKSWLGILIDSLFSLNAIRLHYYKPGLPPPPHYHYHMTLLQSISHLLESCREKGFFTCLRKIRAPQLR